MLKSRLFLTTTLLALTLVPVLHAQTPAADAGPVGGIAPKALFDPINKSSVSSFSAANQSESQVSVKAADSGSGVDVTIQPGEAGYPGVVLKPSNGAPWDLSPYGDVTATITNTGTKPAGISLRVDNDGDWHSNPWSAENFSFKPGETKAVKVIFGYSFGYKPSNPLKSNAVIQVLVFSGKVKDEPLTFHIDSIEASGSAGEKPPVDPSSVRVVPPNGYIVGPGATVDAGKQITANGGAKATVADTTLKLNFPTGTANESVTIKPPAGKWDLRNALQIVVKLHNDGSAPITPSALAGSGGGPTDPVAASAPIAPGGEGEIVIPFSNPKVWVNTPPSNNADPGTGNKFTNNTGSAVTISLPGASAEQAVTVESIQANLPEYSAPDWLGKKPPVDGDWTQTFDEEFSGTSIDETKWNMITDNFWDKRTHFTKEETTVANGMATLTYEKKSGVPENNPSKPATPYAAGYLDTYGKWTQRYGYWEARIKLPSAPGLWPAFWLMPDRGEAAGPQWKRGDTATSGGFKGMEFDICEYLSGWGPNRYNIAMHWDGYEKNHKSTGQVANYAQPDKDGFITCGLLWTPGEAVYYCNGKQMLDFKSDRVSDSPSNIIFNFVSGGWDNLPMDDAKLPSTLVIDYVRVWQRKDLASPVDGPKTPSAAPAPAK